MTLATPTPIPTTLRPIQNPDRPCQPPSGSPLGYFFSAWTEPSFYCNRNSALDWLHFQLLSCFQQFSTTPSPLDATPTPFWRGQLQQMLLGLMCRGSRSASGSGSGTGCMRRCLLRIIVVTICTYFINSTRLLISAGNLFRFALLIRAFYCIYWFLFVKLDFQLHPHSQQRLFVRFVALAAILNW